jgi:hypothetical protein
MSRPCMFCGKPVIEGLGVAGVWMHSRCVLERGRNFSMGNPAMTRQRIDDLVKLCHPDRHQGPMEKLATSTTQWLLGLRERISG